MKILAVVVALLVAIRVGDNAAAQTNSSAISSAGYPWERDQTLLAALEREISAGGILSVQRHVGELEKVLSDAKLTYQIGDTEYVLSDGPADTLAALVIGTTEKKTDTSKVVAVRDPYPMICFYLGNYYNEIGKPGDALRVLNAGLTFSVLPDTGTGDHRYLVVTERGAALMALHRWFDMLPNEDEGLKLPDLKDDARARLLRGRGYALTEMDRLDEAETAYRQSLEFEPNSELANHEIAYIATLKAGGHRFPAGILNSVQKAPPAAQGSKP